MDAATELGDMDEEEMLKRAIAMSLEEEKGEQEEEEQKKRRAVANNGLCSHNGEIVERAQLIALQLQVLQRVVQGHLRQQALSVD